MCKEGIYTYKGCMTRWTPWTVHSVLLIFDLELVLSCLINSDLELHEIINLASSLERYSRPSHEGYRNTIELPDENNVRTIDQSASGKLRNKNAKESWALIEDLALYDNESWNDPKDFAKSVKAISLRHDVPNASDCRLTELENQVQRFMEAHFAPKPSIQVNKIASSCEICSGPHDTQYCMENLEQSFVDYASSRTGETGGFVFNFMASQDARLSKFKADFKQQQCKMTNKTDTFFKTINDQMTGALASDRVKSPKLNVNPTSSVFSARSYPMEDPQSSSRPLNFVNAIKTCCKPTNSFQKDKLQVKSLTINKIETPKPKEPKKALEDEFKDLHLKLPVFEVLAHAPMYNAILDKYVESLELGKNGFAFIQGKMSKKMKDPGLFTLPCRLGDSKPFDTLVDLGTCVNLIPLYLFKKLKIVFLEETKNVLGLADGTKSYPIGIIRNVEVHIGKEKMFSSYAYESIKLQVYFLPVSVITSRSSY
nr:hypothetical protein [Tanacetum cinerariifolium]